MQNTLTINEDHLKINSVLKFISTPFTQISITDSTLERIHAANKKLYDFIEKRVPVYGVTTGFGDSCFRVIQAEQAEELQKNLVLYLNCGTGPLLSESASRAVLLIRLQSLCRGYSGVSVSLIERMKLYLENNWTPVIPREGSLGASGDLIPLSYVAQALQGQGYLHSKKGPIATEIILKEAGIASYVLKAKEGLALVNGTSAMAGLCLNNLQQSRFILNLSTLTTSWLCMALGGKTEPFGVLVNEKAKKHEGQKKVARVVRDLLNRESYKAARGQDVSVNDGHTSEFVQDRYSLRCVPQILGPVLETIENAWTWLEQEINSASDNPLISEDGKLEMGGNFYGGYLAHSMDYLKICLGHIADLQDRQLTYLIDDKSNRGLTPNLADWPSLPESERFLHHGLKGLHQSVSALTSDLLSQSIPNSIFSRSSESHNQDKVSLGMTAAVRCSDMLGTLFTIQAQYLICLAQALDLRDIKLEGKDAVYFYNLVRTHVPHIKRDQSLGENIKNLSENLKHVAMEYGGEFLNL